MLATRFLPRRGRVVGFLLDVTLCASGSRRPESAEATASVPGVEAPVASGSSPGGLTGVLDGPACAELALGTRIGDEDEGSMKTCGGGTAVGRIEVGRMTEERTTIGDVRVSEGGAREENGPGVGMDVGVDMEMGVEIGAEEL